MTLVQSINATIEWWQLMINWVGKQPEADPVDGDRLYRDLDCSWMRASCPLCSYWKNVCKHCPMYPHCVETKESVWHKVGMSRSAGEWLVHAKQMIVLLTDVRKRVKQKAKRIARSRYWEYGMRS